MSRGGETRRDERGLEQADEVAREDVLPGLPPRLVQELAAPPAVLGRRGDGDDVSLLEVEFFVDGRPVVVHRLHYKPQGTPSVIVVEQS